jgi:hypothetical protein
MSAPRAMVHGHLDVSVRFTSTTLAE